LKLKAKMPPKKRKAPDATPVTTAKANGDGEGDAVPAKRARGRPSKAASSATPTAPASVPASEKVGAAAGPVRKRGRPPKKKEEKEPAAVSTGNRFSFFSPFSFWCRLCMVIMADSGRQTRPLPLQSRDRLDDPPRHSRSQNPSQSPCSASKNRSQARSQERKLPS
jgi:hypothetical protein